MMNIRKQPETVAEGVYLQSVQALPKEVKEAGIIICVASVKALRRAAVRLFLQAGTFSARRKIH